MWMFERYPYYQMRVDMDDFHGMACLIQLQDGAAHVNNGQYQYWEMPKAEK